MGYSTLSTFGTLSKYLKVKPDKISIDNLAFKFHYRATCLILLVCTLLVTSRQYVGEHIKCQTDKSIPDHVIDSFCFFTTTFTVLRHYNESMLQEESLPHPGIGPRAPDDEVTYHAYYQWVPFVLFGQAIMFYLPHLLWRTWEGGRIKGLADGLQMVALSRHNMKKQELRLSGNFVITSRDTVDSRIFVIKNEFYKHIKINKSFAKHLILCELLNHIHLFLQIYWTNLFLGGKFLTLGQKFINDDFMGRMDVLDVVFPKVTKCNFFKYGQSGSIQRHDALCIMALNVVNEKIYVVLWFWFLLMIFVSIIAMIWRLFTIIFSSSLRFNKSLFSAVCHSRINTQDLAIVTSHTSFSDWIFLYYLGKNMDSILFTALIADLATELRSKRNTNEHQRLLSPESNKKSNENNIDVPDAIENIDEVDLRKKN